MKMNNGSQTLLETNTDGSLSFQITANATAFQILSSGLYSDKVRAVIRELACNAYDAHIAAGKAGLPVTVILPTVANATFTVKDYGTGLSHEQVVSLYTSYFSSDKRDSNSFTGGFGLGSKSPFAYTDSFSVVACQDGVERVYLCHLNDNGAPSLNKVSETIKGATLQNGVQVSFAVKQADIEQFHDKAMHVLQWFDTKPDVVNATKAWPTKDYVVETASYAIPTNKHDANRQAQNMHATALVKMGNVVYPLDWGRLMDNDKLSQSLVYHGCIELRLPIGAAAIAASREELQYDPKTIANIKRVLHTVALDFGNFLVEKVVPTAEKTWTGASAGARIRNSVQMTFRDQLLQFVTHSTSPDKAVALDLYTNVSWPVPDIGDIDDVTVYWLKKDAIGKKLLRRGVYLKGDDLLRAHMEFCPETVILVCDTNRIAERLRIAKNTGVIRQALIYSAPKERRKEMLAQVESCSKALHGMPIVLASSLPSENVALGVVASSPKKAAAFVPVDDRPVTYFSFVDNTCTEMPFSSVPDQGRYYITKVTAGKFTGSYDVGNEKLWLASDEDDMLRSLENFGKGTAALFARCPGWQAPHGVLLVRPVDIKRLQLVEAGYQPWSSGMEAAMGRPEIAPIIKDLSLEYDDISHYCGRVFYSTPWHAVLRVILTRAKNHPSLWDMLKKAGLDTDIRGYMLANGQSASVRDAVAFMQQKLHEVGLKFGLPMRNIMHMTAAMDKKYPLLQVINRNYITESANLKNPQDVAQMFAGIFGVAPTP